MEEKNPPEYTSGLGEAIRARRQYTGLTQMGMAIRLGMSKRSYQRIETGQDDCPPGLLDSIDDLIDDFNDEVDRLIARHENDPTEAVEVSADPRQEWHRCVVGHASVIEPTITPILVGEEGGHHGPEHRR